VESLKELHKEVPDLPANIRLVWKRLTIAYYGTELIITVKYFIVQAPAVITIVPLLTIKYKSQTDTIVHHNSDV
jgi:hypothetical protein